MASIQSVPQMADPRSEKLADFAQWAHKNITGDEKGQAQIFLDRLFQAFGHAGSLDVGGSPECRIRKAKEDGGGTSFADYVWKPVVLIEMKKRGTALFKHYRQAFDYWTRLVPGRPRYVVLCNFDEFQVYDFETQMDSPVGRVTLTNLSENFGPLNFLFPGQPDPIFDNEHVAVTRQAAATLAKCFNKLINRNVERAVAQRFILQMLIALFAEDIGLLEKYFVTRLLKESNENTSFDLIGGLFRAMNNPAGNAGGRFKGVPYFNGGVFSAPAEIELTGPELILLEECAMFDWSKVQPEIFGTVFEGTLDKDERHAQGAHFTHPADIMKIVGPTIVQPWREQIEGAKTATRLMELLQRLQEFRVLDPACGSGNFLYIAYRELKRLEARIFERIDTEFPKFARPGQMRLSFLSAQNFYGLDKNEFAVELAKVTMMIARKLAIDELHVTEQALPLDNLDQNFRATDALFTTAPTGIASRTLWPAADVIIGNPPFLGAKVMKPEMGTDYVKTLRRLYPEIPGMADFCVYWISRANANLPACTREDPVAGRAGLVGTQNIRNNASRIGGLDQVTINGTIVDAVDNQPWSGEADVHVSIANWINTQDSALIPKIRRIWSKVEPSIATKALWRKQRKRAGKEYDLDVREVAHINSALSDRANVSEARVLKWPGKAPVVCQGLTPGTEGFLLSPQDAKKVKAASHIDHEVVFPYLIGRELLSGNGKPERFIVDFGKMSVIDAQSHSMAFAYVHSNVLSEIQRKAEQEDESESAHKDHLQKWWTLWRPRHELVAELKTIPRYMTCSRVTKRPIFVFVDSAIRPGDALQCFALADNYSFGILQSSPHWQWFVAKCSKLTERLRYSPESVFDTFPWPQNPDAKAISAVAAAGCEVRRIRDEALPKMRGGLRALYRTLELPGANPLKAAHAALDAAVLAAYGFSAKGDLLVQLLALNQQVAANLATRQPVLAPGIPPYYAHPEKLITTDCIRPPC